MQINRGRDFPALDPFRPETPGLTRGRRPQGRRPADRAEKPATDRVAILGVNSWRRARPVVSAQSAPIAPPPDRRWCRASRNGPVSSMSLRSRFEHMQPQINYGHCRNAVQVPENTWKSCMPPGCRSGRRIKFSVRWKACRDPGARKWPMLGPGRWPGLDPAGRRARPPQCWGDPTTMARMVSSPRALHASRR
jgi:hypothetical protein